METLRKDLQNSKYYSICRRKQRWLVDDCNKCSYSDIIGYMNSLRKYKQVESNII
jgi:hypothetical protein